MLLRILLIEVVVCIPPELLASLMGSDMSSSGLPAILHAFRPSPFSLPGDSIFHVSADAKELKITGNLLPGHELDSINPDNRLAVRVVGEQLIVTAKLVKDDQFGRRTTATMQRAFALPPDAEKTAVKVGYDKVSGKLEIKVPRTGKSGTGWVSPDSESFEDSAAAAAIVKSAVNSKSALNAGFLSPEPGPDEIGEMLSEILPQVLGIMGLLGSGGHIGGGRHIGSPMDDMFGSLMDEEEEEEHGSHSADEPILVRFIFDPSNPDIVRVMIMVPDTAVHVEDDHIIVGEGRQAQRIPAPMTLKGKEAKLEDHHDGTDARVFNVPMLRPEEAKQIKIDEL